MRIRGRCLSEDRPINQRSAYKAPAISLQGASIQLYKANDAQPKLRPDVQTKGPRQTVTSLESGVAMTVKELMTSNVRACDADANLATVATMMWDGDCGSVPVVNDERRVVGIVTDRDICIAAATRSVSPSNLHVEDAMSKAIHTCAAGDDVRAALKTMRQHRVRRLPVLDQEGRLAGMLSMNDLIAEAELHKGAELPAEEVLETLKSISAHSRPLAMA